jgi:hypothetical protein
MYSESDIEAAVAAGALTPQAAAALRDSVAQSRESSAVDEESFRLLTGFNDIFVTIAAVLLLVAVGWIGANIGTSLFGAGGHGLHLGSDASLQQQRSFGLAGAIAGLLVAATSWGLAEYFTRRRRMALPSIILLAAFVYAVAAAAGGLGLAVSGLLAQRGFATVAGFAGLAAAAGAWFHWRRFYVPITIAALTAALVATAVSLFFAAFPNALSAWLWVLLVAGLAVFAYAMWWDMSDRTRTTRRSDVAFWLHLFAAPMIAHPFFALLGVSTGQIGVGVGVAVILLYVAFGIVALAIDRRALLVSSLAYVLSALAQLFQVAGAISLNIALTALVIGSALLMLSAFWHPIRRLVVERLPADVQARLPLLDRPVAMTRPA